MTDDELLIAAAVVIGAVFLMRRGDNGSNTTIYVPSSSNTLPGSGSGNAAGNPRTGASATQQEQAIAGQFAGPAGSAFVGAASDVLQSLPTWDAPRPGFSGGLGGNGGWIDVDKVNGLIDQVSPRRNNAPQTSNGSIVVRSA